MKNGWIKNDLLYLLAFVFLISGAVRAKEITGEIRGQILESGTGKPIFGANVLLSGTMLGAASDEAGNYVVSGIFPGMYTISVSAIGYKKTTRTIQIHSDETIRYNFSLDETPVLMDGVAVTASRYQQSLDELPISLNLVPSEELVERNITSVDQALQYVPGVNTTGGGQVNIRGSSGFNWGVGSRVLVLLNGNPFMAGDLWNVNWYAIPTSNIKQIEVMKGSGSALYGSSAMGGVINIITEDPEKGSHFQVRSFSGFYNKLSHEVWQWTDDQNHFEGTTVDLSTYVGPVSVLLSSNYQNTTGYKENDDHQIFNFMATLGCNLSSRLRIDVMTGYGNNKGGFFIYWKDLRHSFSNGSDPFGYQTRSQYKNTYIFPSLSYVLNERMMILIKGRINRAYSEDHLRNSVENNELPEAFRSSTAITQGGEVQLNWQVHRQGILVMGCDLQKDEVNAIQFDSCEVDKAAYYVQFEQRFWDRLKLTAGARYDWEDAARIGKSGDLSKKLGMNYTLTPATHLRFSYGEGFRMPTVGERFVSTFTGGLRIAPNHELKPERSISIEMGVHQNLSNSMGIDVALYYNRYTNLIEPQLDVNDTRGIVVRFQNVAEARVQGVDLSFRTDWFSKLVSSRIGYTFADSKDLSPGDDYGEPLKYRSKHTLYITNEIVYSYFSLGFDFRYLSRIERVDEYHRIYIKDIDRVVPTYVVALRFGYSQKRLSLNLIIDNLFQYNYLISPANMGPPRTAILQLGLNY